MSAAKKGGDLTPAVFTYGDTQQVRTLVVKNQPWFVAKDLCGILGLSNSRKAMTGLDEDEVMVSAILTSDVADVTNGYTRVQRRNMQLVNESGLYSLIFRSRKAEAKVFRRWVTGTVLPSIRRTGGYQKPATRRPSPMQPRATREEHAERRLFTSPAARQYWDAQHLPYDRIAFMQGEVRMVVLRGRAWYNVQDLLYAIGTMHRQPLNAVRHLASENKHHIKLFGMSASAWFVDDTALRMLMVARGDRIGQLTLNLA